MFITIFIEVHAYETADVTLTLNPRPSLRAARCKSPLDYLLIAHDLGKGTYSHFVQITHPISSFNLVYVHHYFH